MIEENELYEIYYEYDTNYVHAFWGAVRESSMLLCNNPSHRFHVTPDYFFEQDLLSVYEDCVMVIKKIVSQISSYIDLPEFYTNKYGVPHA